MIQLYKDFMPNILMHSSSNTLAQSSCTASSAIIVGSDDVSPPLPSCNGLSFPFEVTLSD